MMMRHAQALFPVKVAGAGCKLNRVEVTAYPQQAHAGRKSCPSGKSAEVKRLLGYARYGEGIEAVDMDVVVHMDDTDFDEGSYGLALAISDKLARFGVHDAANDKTSDKTGDETGDTPPATPDIVATGIIGNQGAVTAIGAFPEKLALVLDSQGPGTLFVFPAANRDDRQADIAAGLAALTAKGIAWRAVASIVELSDLWRETPQATAPLPETPQTVPPWRANLMPFARGLLLGFLLVLGLAAGLALLQGL
jgi:hypothetical protein